MTNINRFPIVQPRELSLKPKSKFRIHLGIDYRNQVIRFYQSSPEDAVSKGKFFPQRMSAYFAYADLMYFYWSDDLFSQERLAAVWQKGKMKIHDGEAMQRFVEKYESDRAALAAEGQVIPAFESYLGKP